MQDNQNSKPDISGQDSDQDIHDSTNRAFNQFLNLQPSNLKLLTRYHNVLMKNGEIFAAIFYDYLMSSPVTAEALSSYQKQGGEINRLVKKQIQHLFRFLSGNIDATSVQHMENIGKLHHHHNIEPVWIMGAYKLYLDHLKKCIHSSTEIKDDERSDLENTITKLLFRDMGLMLEGYWQANLSSLSEEKKKVTDLQNQITSLLANIPQLLWSIDTVNNKPLYISPAAKKFCNKKMDMKTPIPCLDSTIPEHRKKLEFAWQNALQGEAMEVETREAQTNGKQLWFRRLFYPSVNSTGDVVRIDGLMEDITESKVTLDRLNTLATTDSLTGLANRSLFYDRLNQAIAATSRHKDQQIAIMLMDLDHFKEINDTLGHPAGDQVLTGVTQRLQALLRNTDTLARLGGDEFGILLLDAEDGRRTAEKIALKVQRAFVEPYHHKDIELFLGISIGVSLFPEHGDDVATLMSRADVAMYHTKNTDMTHMVYNANLNPDAQQHLQLSSDLRYALERNELTLHYQPKIDLKSNTIVGAEALIRWDHPEHGLIFPDKFIPLAEHTGLIIPITKWVIDTAVTQSKTWLAAGHEIQIAVNLSVRSFHDDKLVDDIRQVIQRENIPANLLEVEITENILISDINKVSNILMQINALGVSIAIDDFGTGYSSLFYLKTLPLNTLKIDRSFVMNMYNDENDTVIVRSTIDLAHNLGLSVVAEGIENSDALNLLIKLGCDGGQGYHFSKPKPHDDFFKTARH